MNTSSHTAMEQGGSFGVGAVVNAAKDGKSIQVTPELNFVNGKQKAEPAQAFGHMLIIMDMNVGMGGPNSTSSVRLVVHSSDMSQAAVVPVLTAEISRKPLINFLWAGTILLFIGLIISMYRRFSEESASRKLSPVSVSETAEQSSVKVPTVAAVGNTRKDGKKTEVENVEN